MSSNLTKILSSRVAVSILLLFVLLSLCSCVSTSSIVDYSSLSDSELIQCLFDDYSAYKGSVCMGISGPYSNKTTAVSVATQNCLQILAFYRGLAVQTDYNSIIRSSEAEDLFSSDSFAGTVDSVYESVASEMEIVDVKWYGGCVGAVVFAKLPEMKGVSSWKDCNWLEQVPELDGYYVAVATSDKTYSFLNSSIEAATFRTAQRLLDENKDTITVSVSNVETDSKSYNEDSYSISGNRISEFLILDYEYDALTNKVYALGICKK